MLELNDVLAEMDSYNGGYRCDFSEDYCGWSLSGPMKWERIKVMQLKIF